MNSTVHTCVPNETIFPFKLVPFSFNNAEIIPTNQREYKYSDTAIKKYIPKNTLKPRTLLNNTIVDNDWKTITP